jgi:hypothetical protein
MDGIIYSDTDKGLSAGIYLTAYGKRIVWNDMCYEEISADTVCVTLISEDGSARLTFREDGIDIDTDIDGFSLVPECDKDRVFGTLKDADKFANNNNRKTALSYISSAEAKDDRLSFTINGFDYAIKITKGEVGKGLSVTAVDGRIAVCTAQ